ncbi:MAG: adventurous gliding motility protein AgmC [Deltaproteobacteria bacterium]
MTPRPLALLPLLAAGVALASPDTFFLGDGHDGALTVRRAGSVINAYAQIVGAVAQGDTQLPVDTTAGFAQGDLVLVVQTAGLSPTPASGTPGPIDLSQSPVGRWELARLSGTAAGALSLSAPLLQGYATSVSQLVRVPEYTSVTVNAGAGLVASAWNGSKGGILAFLSTGAVQNDGALSAGGAGFQGGPFVNSSSAATGCGGLDEPSPSGGQKGEGVAPGFGANAAGDGQVANGAGGGDCLEAGGGGGGNAAPGGPGGDS